MNDEAMDPADDAHSISHLLFRSVDAFLELPVEYRWEFTRRHPYYLLCWRAARAFRESPSNDEAERFCQQAASLVLNAINVAPNVPPPDPRDEIAALGYGSIAGGWVGGAVAPAMLRTLAHMLLLALPKSQRSQLGRLLNESAEFEVTDRERMSAIHERLSKLPGEAWNSFPEAPIVSINLQSPQRAVTEAIETLVRQWKDERGIAETRRRDDKLKEYLEVWDLREGWHGGEYHGDRELKLQEIAAQLQVGSINTIVNRYRSAFRHLTGHEYRPELWIRLFGGLKLATADQLSRLAMRRPWRSRNLRPVAESVLLPGRREPDDQQFLAGVGITGSDLSVIELQLDIQSLLERGYSDEQICSELFSDGGQSIEDVHALVAALRSRRDESL